MGFRTGSMGSSFLGFSFFFLAPSCCLELPHCFEFLKGIRVFGEAWRCRVISVGFNFPEISRAIVVFAVSWFSDELSSFLELSKFVRV